MSNGTPEAYPDPNNGGGLAPEGLLPEAGKILSKFSGRSKKDIVNKPRGTLHGQGLIDHAKKLESSGAKRQALDTDEINTSLNLEAVCAKAAHTLGRRLSSSEKNTIRKIAELLSRHLPDAPAIAYQLAGQLFDKESNGAKAIDSIMTSLETLAVGPAGSAATLLNPLSKTMNPVMGADEADVAAREFIAAAYEPGSNGSATGKMSTDEMSSFIEGEAARGRNPFVINNDKVDTIIKEGSNQEHLISSDTFGRIKDAEEARIRERQAAAESYGVAVKKAVNTYGGTKSAADRRKLTDYAKTTETRKNLKETINKVGVNEDLKTVESIQRARDNIQKQIRETKGDDAKSRKSRQQLIAIDTRLKNQEEVHKDALGVQGMSQQRLDQMESTAKQNYEEQLRELYQKDGRSESDMRKIIEVQKRKQFLKAADRDYDGLRGSEENEVYKEALLLDPETSDEVKEAIRYLDANQDAVKLHDAAAEELTQNYAGEKITRYEDLMRQDPTTYNDQDKKDLAELQHDEVIRDYRTTIGIGENNKKLLNRAKDFQVFRKAIRSTTPEIDADNIRQVNAVLEGITQGSLNEMSEKTRSDTIQEISSLMAEQGADANIALDASRIGAEVAESLGENTAEAGVLAAKAGLSAYNSAIKAGKSAASATKMSAAAAKRAGKAANSEVAKGLGGLQEYIRIHQERIDNMETGTAKTILQKIAKKQTLTKEESDFIGGDQNLRRIMKEAGASESEIVQMYNTRAIGDDKEYADNMAYQANAKDKMGLWAARDTMGVIGRSASNESVKEMFTGKDGIENQQKLMDLAFENPDIAKAENVEEARRLLAEKFKDNKVVMEAIKTDAGVYEIQKAVREAQNEYINVTGDSTFLEAAQNVTTAQNYGENVDRNRRNSILEREAPASYSSSIAHAIDVFLSNPDASASELAGKFINGGFNLESEEDKQNASRLISARMLNSDADTVNGLLRGKLDKERFTKAQETLKKIDEAGLFDKYAKYANGKMSKEEAAAFSAEMVEALGGDTDEGKVKAKEELKALESVNQDLYQEAYEKIDDGSAEFIAMPNSVEMVEDRRNKETKKTEKTQNATEKAEHHSEQVRSEETVRAVEGSEEAVSEPVEDMSGYGNAVSMPSAAAIADQIAQKTLRVEIVEIERSAAEKLQY